MKKFYILLISLLMASGASAQSCLSEGITFTTQAQIDSFQVNYPDCTDIIGDVVINSEYGITNLNGLSILTSIGGNLNVVDNYSLSSLAGMEGLTSIGSWLNIVFNDSLSSLSGLEGLTSIGGGLVIHVNKSLTNLTGLEGLTSMGNVLRIVGNISLSSLIGLDNINAGSIDELQIIENPSLSTCDVNSICGYLFNPSGTIDIQNNATGCNSKEEVQMACTFGLNEDVKQKDQIVVSPNPASTNITISTPTTPNKNTFMTIFNINGQVLFTRQISEKQTQIDVGSLVQCVYLVRLTDDRTVMVGKFVKQ